MKVVFVTPFCDDPARITGGVAAASIYLADELSRLEGVQVEVIALDASREERVVEHNGITIHYLRRPRWPTGAGRLWLETPLLVRRKLSEMEYDLVHVHGVASLAVRLDCPTVLTLHGVSERDMLHRHSRIRHLKSLAMGFCEGRARQRAPNIIVTSPYLLTLFKAGEHSRVWSFDNPIADGFFQIQRQVEPGRILFCGLIVPRKNVTTLLEAVAQLVGDYPDVQLRLAGQARNEAYADTCRALAHRLGIEERVAFLGGLSVTQLQEEMSRASCMALCSLQETAPLAISEAMAAGVPVVASRVGGIPHLVSDGQTGRLVAAENTEEVVSALRMVLDPAVGREMSAQAREAAERRFRASHIAAKTYEVYKTVLQQGSGGQVP